jgi:hypothetical protein
MSIINRGVFDSGTAFLRQAGNDWPRAQVITTAEIIESSSNLYFTNVRVVETVTPLLTTANVVETSANLYFTNTRAVSALVGANVLVNNLVVSGDLEVQGNVVTLNTATLNVEDKNILLANGAATSSAADGAGILIAGAQANITYSDTGDKFVINKNTDITGNVVANAIVSYGDITATGNIITRDVRATGNLVANGLIIRNINVSDSILTGNIITASTTSNVIVADSITANIWNGLYTANVIESYSNLYFTNTRVVSALIPGTAITIEANGRISANISDISVQTAAISAQVTSLSNFTTANLTEGTNLYYTNARVRSAISAGKGITIDNNGVIKNTGSTPLFNTDINGAGSSNVLATMDVEVAFPSVPATDRFLLRSLLVVNLTESTAQVSGNILYATGNTASFANKIPIPAGGLLEFYEKGQLFQPGDKVNLQGFDAAGVPTANILNAVYTYETFSNDIAYIGTGTTLSANATNIQVYDSAAAFSIVESIKVVNLGSEIPKVRLYMADANGTPKGFLAFGTPIPVNASVEFLQTAKRLEITDKLFAYYTGANANSVSVFVSAKTGPTFTPGFYTPNVELSGTVSALFGTTENDGTLLYYTIE